jgi:RNA polymerase sigma factor for flagellar operon FliA
MTRNVSWDDIAASNSGHLANAADRPDLLLEHAERKRLVTEAITQLPESERLSIILYYMEELRLKEIGRVLNLSESRVSRLLKSAEHRIEEHIRAKEDNAA